MYRARSQDREKGTKSSKKSSYDNKKDQDTREESGINQRNGLI